MADADGDGDYDVLVAEDNGADQTFLLNTTDLSDVTDLLDAFEASYVVDGGHLGVDVPCDSRGVVRVGVEPRKEGPVVTEGIVRSRGHVLC